MRRRICDGIYVGAHSRVYDRAGGGKVAQRLERFRLGAVRPRPSAAIRPMATSSFTSLASAYEPPEILKRIATDREQPYTHYERKRTRNRWRFYRRAARAGVQDHLRAAGVCRRFRPGRHAATHPGTLLGCHLERSRPARRAEHVLHAASLFVFARVTDLLHLSARHRQSPTWSARRRATIRPTSSWAARRTNRSSRTRIP